VNGGKWRRTSSQVAEFLLGRKRGSGSSLLIGGWPPPCDTMERAALLSANGFAAAGR